MIKKFFHDTFSVDELRISILALGFFAVMVTVVILALTNRKLDSGLVDIVITLSLTIGGVNGLNMISNVLTKRSNSQSESDTSEIKEQPTNSSRGEI